MHQSFEFGCTCDIVGNLQWGKFNGGDLEIKKFKVWQILKFEQFLVLKIQLIFFKNLKNN